MTVAIIVGIICAVVGVVLGFILGRFLVSSQARKANQEAEQLKKNASAEADTLIENTKKQVENMRREAEIAAKEQAIQYKQQLDDENKNRLDEVRSAEARMNQREESLDRRVEALDLREHQLSSLQGVVESKERAVEEAQAEVSKHLEEIAGMSPQEAKAEMLAGLSDELNHDAAAIIRDSEERTKAEADKRARMIISLAIQRLAADHTAESTVSTIQIPSEDIKGRIIGREGRNIRSFEQITGVNLIIDDTPECVTLSCFDPVRREIGRVTLENLITDGRIHPSRIEEMFKKATDLVDQRIKDAGEQAAFDAGIHDLDPELVRILGRLCYRTSYGQNVLNHSLEVSYLAGAMASELGLDPILFKRAGLLHDIGKAIDHEVEGTHPALGADLARRYGESPEIVHSIEAHHGDIEPNTILDVIIQAADAISAARPGARKESLESYIKRLEKLEAIANDYEGVERTYAIQAGREVRVMVIPEMVDEDQAVLLSHDIAHKIEDEMQYPGQIKVVVIRESRAIDYAK